jgi:hypothetical protein
MSASSGPSIQTDGLVFDYDMSNTKKSFIGPPATDRIVSTPLTLTVYAYATGPVSTANIIDATYQPRTVSRYTISNNINTARAMVTSSGLTTGVSYTFSCKIKYNGTNVATPSFSVDASKGNPEGGANNNTVSSSAGATTSLGNGWYYVTYTWSYSACPTSGCYLTYGVVTGSDAAYLTNTFDVYEPQFEVGSFATPYVTQSNGVRSTAQALLDLTNKNTITASSLTYASDNTFSFNGSSNYIDCGNILSDLTNLTLECWIKFGTQTSSYNGILSKTLNNSNGYELRTTSFTSTTTSVEFRYKGDTASSGSTTLSNNIWYNIVGTGTFGSQKLYINGLLVLSSTVAVTPDPNALSFVIGKLAYAGLYMNGSIPVAKVYNRALSATEIQQNFNAQRTRYGI